MTKYLSIYSQIVAFEKLQMKLEREVSNGYSLEYYVVELNGNRVFRYRVSSQDRECGIEEATKVYRKLKELIFGNNDTLIELTGYIDEISAFGGVIW